MISRYLVSHSNVPKYLNGVHNVPEEAVFLGELLPQMPMDSWEAYYCMPEDLDVAKPKWEAIRDRKKKQRDDYYSQPWV